MKNNRDIVDGIAQILCCSSIAIVFLSILMENAYVFFVAMGLFIASLVLVLINNHKYKKR